MRVLIDTDVVLDVILAREPFAKDAAELLDLSEKGFFQSYVSAITPLNIFYIARKAKAVRDQAGDPCVATKGWCLRNRQVRYAASFHTRSFSPASKIARAKSNLICAFSANLHR